MTHRWTRVGEEWKASIHLESREIRKPQEQLVLAIGWRCRDALGQDILSQALGVCLRNFHLFQSMSTSLNHLKTLFILCVSVYSVYVWYPRRPEEGSRSSGPGVTAGCDGRTLQAGPCCKNLLEDGIPEDSCVLQAGPYCKNTPSCSLTNLTQRERQGQNSSWTMRPRPVESGV